MCIYIIDYIAGRQWTYQTCTEFGFYQTSDYKTQPFGNKFPLNFFIIQCQDIFDPKFNADLISRGINQTNAIYGGYGIKVTNVVFPNGSIDPWHALGIVKDLSPDATAIYIDGKLFIFRHDCIDIDALIGEISCLQTLLGNCMHVYLHQG